MVDMERLKNVRGELKLAKVSRNLGDFFISKLPGDNTDLRGRIHSLASVPLCRVLPRIGMILV